MDLLCGVTSVSCHVARHNTVLNLRLLLCRVSRLPITEYASSPFAGLAVCRLYLHFQELGQYAAWARLIRAETHTHTHTDEFLDSSHFQVSAGASSYPLGTQKLARNMYTHATPIRSWEVASGGAVLPISRSLHPDKVMWT